MGVDVRINQPDIAAIEAAVRHYKEAASKVSVGEIRSVLNKFDGVLRGITENLEDINRFISTDAVTKEDLSRQRQALETTSGAVRGASRLTPIAVRLLGPLGVPAGLAAGALAGGLAGAEAEERRRQIAVIQEQMANERYLNLRVTERYLREVRAREEAYLRALRGRR